ncbi:MAG TPA: MFS transporter [Chloroflexota bacterium]|nr:MFS transporter [Chloroflexota bacterium]
MSVKLEAAPVRPGERTHRRDAFFLAADLATFHLGMAFASQNTVIPAFAERLGAPNLVIGAVPALMTVGWTLPAIFAANHTQGLARKLPFILKWTILERVSYPLLGVAAIWLAPRSPEATLALLLGLLLLMTVIGGLLMPAWLDLIGRVVPTTARGRFFAFANGGGALLGLSGAAGVGLLLDRYPFPLGYGLCFLAGTACLAVSYLFLALVREPPGGASGQRLPQLAYMRRLPGLIRSNRNLPRFLTARALSVVGHMANGFFTVYALKELGAGDAAVGAFTALMLAAQTAGAFAFGWLADRRGHVLVLTLGAAASALAALAGLAARDVLTLYPVFVLAGLGLAAIQVSGMAVGMELGPDEERPTYVAINNSWVAPYALVAPLAGGLMADRLGYGALFATAAAFSALAAGVFALAVRDPRRLPSPEPVRGSGAGPGWGG